MSSPDRPDGGEGGRVWNVRGGSGWNSLAGEGVWPQRREQLQRHHKTCHQDGAKYVDQQGQYLDAFLAHSSPVLRKCLIPLLFSFM